MTFHVENVKAILKEMDSAGIERMRGYLDAVKVELERLKACNSFIEYEQINTWIKDCEEALKLGEAK